MPNSQTGREKVLAYIEENNVQLTDLASMYGYSKQDFTNYLKGSLQNTPMAHKIILRIISDFKIR
ncbi:hypothetical protein [Jeotgalibaca porci]|uniref:hypothetical protein n=1 Tax=Jeotgalibaca porci TaxID=1868793 RepID=UPI00359F29B7